PAVPTRRSSELGSRHPASTCPPRPSRRRVNSRPRPRLAPVTIAVCVRGSMPASMPQGAFRRRRGRDLWPAPRVRSPRTMDGPSTREDPMPIAHRQPRRGTVLALALAAALGTAAPLAWAEAPPAAARTAVGIPYEEFTLPNGLHVVVHTDRKAPIMAVNIWYHVGSKDDPSGRSGFAHLFEHMMFQASEILYG